MPATLQDVARKAGVSAATASRVLADKPYVSEETQQRVLAAVAELGYRPNRVARSLRAQRCSIIGLIISDIQNPFFTSLVRAVEDVAYAHQYAVFLCNSDEDIDKEALYIDLMQAERVSGVIISPTRETDTPCHELVEANIPVVSVDRRILDLQVDTVVVDNVGASFELTSHLIQNGHQRIGAVFGPQGATTGRERREGYVRALEAHGLPLLPHLVRSGMPKEALGHQFAREVLDLPDPPTALYAGNNLLAIGAIKAIDERGLRIPEDVALASFDEMDWTTLVQPALTVVAQPTYELGRTAAALLLERIRDGARPIQTVTLKPRLIVRESCARHGGRRRLAQKQ